MNMTPIINSESNGQQRPASSGFRVDVSRGERIGRGFRAPMTSVF